MKVLLALDVKMGDRALPLVVQTDLRDRWYLWWFSGFANDVRIKYSVCSRQVAVGITRAILNNDIDQIPQKLRDRISRHRIVPIP